jgi:hypothetical protein
VCDGNAGTERLSISPQDINMRGAYRRPAGIVIALLAALGCSNDAHTAASVVDDSGDVQVSVRTASIVAPDSVSPGWRRMHVEETEGAHIVVAFRLPVTSTDDDLAAFIAALDTAPVTPLPAVAIGGPEVGARGDVVVHFTPGVYVLACVRRGEDGHRHASTGESRVLHVRAVTAADSAFLDPPANAHEVRMVDFAFVGSEQWSPGAQLLRIENIGTQDHQLRLVRLRDGASMKEWMEADDPGALGTPIAGMARVGPGQVAYLPVDLAPGNYVASCLVADANTKMPHVELGMFRAITVR